MPAIILPAKLIIAFKISPNQFHKVAKKLPIPSKKLPMPFVKASVAF